MAVRGGMQEEELVWGPCVFRCPYCNLALSGLNAYASFSGSISIFRRPTHLFLAGYR